MPHGDYSNILLMELWRERLQANKRCKTCNLWSAWPNGNAGWCRLNDAGEKIVVQTNSDFVCDMWSKR